MGHGAIGQLAPSFDQVGDHAAATLLVVNQGEVTAATGHNHGQLARPTTLAWFVEMFLPRRANRDPEIAADLPDKLEQEQE